MYLHLASPDNFLLIIVRVMLLSIIITNNRFTYKFYIPVSTFSKILSNTVNLQIRIVGIPFSPLYIISKLLLYINNLFVHFYYLRNYSYYLNDKHFTTLIYTWNLEVYIFRLCSTSVKWVGQDLLSVIYTNSYKYTSYSEHGDMFICHLFI